MRNPSVVRRRLSFCAAIMLAAAIPASPPRAIACPAPPTLGEMIEESDTIFVAREVSHQTMTLEAEDGQEHPVPAVLVRIETVLKGPVEPHQEVLLAYGWFQSPEGPPRTQPLLVLADLSEELDGYVTQAFFDVDDERAREVYVSRVREMLDLLALPESSDERRARHLEWAVRCVEEPETRDSGVRDLWVARWRYQADGAEEPAPLEPAHVERLVAALLSSTEFDDWSTFTLAQALGGTRDPRVAAHFRGELERLLEEPAPHARMVMFALAEHFDWTTGRWLANRYDPEASPKAQRDAVERYLALMAELDELPEAFEEDPEGLTAGEEAVAEIEERVAEAEAEFEEAVEDAEEVELAEP